MLLLHGRDTRSIRSRKDLIQSNKYHSQCGVEGTTLVRVRRSLERVRELKWTSVRKGNQENKKNLPCMHPGCTAKLPSFLVTEKGIPQGKLFCQDHRPKCIDCSKTTRHGQERCHSCYGKFRKQRAKEQAECVCAKCGAPASLAFKGRASDRKCKNCMEEEKMSFIELQRRALQKKEEIDAKAASQAPSVTPSANVPAGPRKAKGVQPWKDVGMKGRGKTDCALERVEVSKNPFGALASDESTKEEPDMVFSFGNFTGGDVGTKKPKQSVEYSKVDSNGDLIISFGFPAAVGGADIVLQEMKEERKRLKRLARNQKRSHQNSAEYRWLERSLLVEAARDDNSGPGGCIGEFLDTFCWD